MPRNPDDENERDGLGNGSPFQNPPTSLLAAEQSPDSLRLAGAELERERRWLDEVQRVAKIGSWIYDIATAGLTWSDETYRIFAISRNEPLNMELLIDRIHPGDRENWSTRIDEAISRRSPVCFDHRLLLPDGSIRWVQERFEVIVSGSGEPLRAIGTVQDINDRKASDLALNASQQLLRIASRVGQIGGWDVDLQTLKVSWSDAVCDIHGVPHGYQPSVEEAISFYGESSRETIQEAFSTCVSDGTPFDLELQIVNTSGEEIWIRAIGEACIDSTGIITGVSGAFQNIEERKRASDVMRESDERFRIVAQATNDVIWDWNFKTNLTWFSEGLNTQLGYDNTDPRPLHFWLDLIHPDDRERVHGSITSSIANGQLWTSEYRFEKSDGAYVNIFDRGYVVRGPDGVPLRMIGAMMDVTNQRRLEAQVEQIQRVASLGQLAANMAHEFNNVLMGVQPFAEIIRRSAPESTRVQDAAVRILHSVQRGKKITDDILRFTRRVEPALRPINVREWIREFEAEARALAGDDVEVEVVLPEQPLEFYGDVAQLNQVLANLVINARDASERGSRLIITAERESNPSVGDSDSPEFVHVFVRDYGSGIPSSTLQHIFEPLFTTKKSGTGLGLAISHQVVTQHGGTISVESDLGPGTCFHILLPMNKPRSEPAGMHDSARDSLPSSVLIVDDEKTVAEGIAMLLSTENVRSSIVQEGKAVASAIERDRPELVLLDIGLADVSGVDVFREIHGQWPRLPVVLMTGHYSRAELDTILVLPHVGFLQKPFTQDDLFGLLKVLSSEASVQQPAQ